MKSISLKPIIPISIILIFSLSTVWSTAPSLFTSQLVFILLAVLAVVLVSRVDSHILHSLTIPSYVFSIFLLVLTLILGTVTRGSVRWIEIGSFRLQASEITKPFLILSFAGFLSQPAKQNLTWLAKQLGIFVVPALLIFLEPDLGSTLIITGVWVALLVSARPPTKYLIMLLLIGLTILPASFFILKPYQRQRLTGFVNPYADPQGSGYNVIQSQIAIGSGKFFGKGVRQGTQSQLKFLPERHTDFAFASFAEEFGFLGSSLLIISYFSFLFWLISLLRTQNLFTQLIIYGTFWLFFLQIMINLGMNMGLLPVTGITLPLFSYGGSSILSFGLVIGLLLASL